MHQNFPVGSSLRGATFSPVAREGGVVGLGVPLAMERYHAAPLIRQRGTMRTASGVGEPT